MTTKELIRREIERRKNKAETMRERGAYLELLSFLDTLPDEPVTDCHDLEEEISRTYRDGSVTDTSDIDHVAYENIARHFAEWGADHLRDTPKKVSEDLEEAAENSWAVYEYRESPKGLYSTCYVDGFKAGAEWQRKQDEKNYAWVKQLPNPNIEKLDGIEITTSDSSAGGKELLYVSNKSYNIGLRDGMAEQKRKMMEGAVEGVVNHGTAVSYVISDEDQLDERLKQFQNDAEVRIIILPKEEEG